MNNKYILESLASDLKRVALGLHRESNVMAQKFLDEALKRRDELETERIPPYIKRVLVKLNKQIRSDDALMYGILIQNYTQNTTF